MNVSRFSAHNAELGESPRWNGSEHALYWVDVVGRTLHRRTPGRDDETRWPLPGLPGALAFRRAGGLLLALRNGIVLSNAPGQPWRAVDLPGIDFARERINDGATDSLGRFWFGTFSPQLAPGRGSLYRLDPDLRLYRMDSGFSMSNGIAFSPDERSMYFADTHGGRIWRYDFDAAAGTVSAREPFVDYQERHGLPDGCCIDTLGRLWVAEVGGARVACYAAHGDPARAPEIAIDLPVSKPTAVAFGGDGLSTLFIATQWRGLPAAERKRQPLAGACLAVLGPARGIPPHPFAA
ncbi:CBU_1789 family Dot/Icm type IV secretion system effector [Pigmentiphaga soli]|uniref:CBU_1789 family Dot/Icm type IV secretion system effector n=1 Tax=Pigmentiphaga soli TaxID=1007095 RepID=A0ABP8GSK8_9BURK